MPHLHSQTALFGGAIPRLQTLNKSMQITAAARIMHDNRSDKTYHTNDQTNTTTFASLPACDGMGACLQACRRGGLPA
jgi:succinate dehydrogenase/fumarate reductase-like Fe-S protein